MNFYLWYEYAKKANWINSAGWNEKIEIQTTYFAQVQRWKRTHFRKVKSLVPNHVININVSVSVLFWFSPFPFTIVIFDIIVSKFSFVVLLNILIIFFSYCLIFSDKNWFPGKKILYTGFASQLKFMNDNKTTFLSMWWDSQQGPTEYDEAFSLNTKSFFFGFEQNNSIEFYHFPYVFSKWTNYHHLKFIFNLSSFFSLLKYIFTSSAYFTVTFIG